jgi:hypothetical protein
VLKPALTYRIALNLRYFGESNLGSKVTTNAAEQMLSITMLYKYAKNLVSGQ